MTKAGMSRIIRLIIFLPIEMNYLKKLKVANFSSISLLPSRQNAVQLIPLNLYN